MTEEEKRLNIPEFISLLISASQLHSILDQYCTFRTADGPRRGSCRELKDAAATEAAAEAAAAEAAAALSLTVRSEEISRDVTSLHSFSFSFFFLPSFPQSSIRNVLELQQQQQKNIQHE